MYRSILVPLDGSPFGEHALPLAAGLARRSGAAVTLLHVHTPLKAIYAEIQLYDDTIEEGIRQQHKVYLTGAQGRLAHAVGRDINLSMREGNIVEQIQAQVAESGADLVVMTTHARGPLGRFWLGSVTDKLMRDLNVPLLLIHPHGEQPDLKRDLSLKHVLIPLDGSSLAEQIVEPAVQLGGPQADYTLFRVVAPLLPYPYQVEGDTMGEMASNLADQVTRIHNQMREEAHAYLEGVARRLRERGLRVMVQVAVDNQPAAGIVHQAVAPVVDVVALATHGRRGLSRLFLGSVADKVIRNCAVPVLVFRPRSE